MSTSFLVAAIGLPIVGAAHMFAVEYGYRGASRSEALATALRVGAELSIFTGIFVVAALFE